MLLIYNVGADFIVSFFFFELNLHYLLIKECINMNDSRDGLIECLLGIFNKCVLILKAFGFLLNLIANRY